MNTQPIERHDNGIPMKTRSPSARRAVRASGIRAARVVARCFDFAGIASRQRIARISCMEETIARVIADNPPQLYRGGA